MSEPETCGEIGTLYDEEAIETEPCVLPKDHEGLHSDGENGWTWE